VSASTPYRAFEREREAFVPSFAWTRRATFAITALGALLPLRVVYDLLTDHDCAKQPSPHYALAAFVVIGALMAGALGVRSQRWAARTLARRVRVRSRWAAILYAALSMCPPVCIALATAAAVAFIDAGATFHLCFDTDFTLPNLLGC
jgi:hypothetical protein